MPREIEITWTTQAGTNRKSVMFFDTAHTNGAQRSAIQSWLAGVVGALDVTTSYVVATAGREWNDATGALEGAWTENVARTGTGTVSGEPLPDATQLLVRWQTPAIVDGRFLAGRTFIPGIARINSVDGNVEPAIRTALQTAAQTLITANVGLVVWHRPRPAEPVSAEFPAGRPFRAGSTAGVTIANVWSEWAVLRRRRS